MNGSRQHACQSASLRWRRKRGASEQAIGITEGGRNSKIHGLVDKLCRPWVLIFTPGNTADCNVIERCYCRLKDLRRIATRYDKLARNYFSALCLVAAVAFWLQSCAVPLLG